ncbi:MAG: glutamine synthetase beta-grasp domain-containing protein, partial [bacterium]
MTTPKDVLDFIKKNDIEFVDFKFIDLLGTWQHLQVPIGVVNEAMLEEGVMFDGSSIRCWQTIDASDMKMIPDLSTMKVDPF